MVEPPASKFWEQYTLYTGLSCLELFWVLYTGHSAMQPFPPNAILTMANIRLETATYITVFIRRTMLIQKSSNLRSRLGSTSRTMPRSCIHHAKKNPHNRPTKLHMTGLWLKRSLGRIVIPPAQAVIDIVKAT